MILLDTHVWIWTAADPKRLSKPAAQAIRRAVKSDGVGVAAISLFEAAWLLAHGRVRLPGTVQQALGRLLEATRVQVPDLSAEIAVTAAQLAGKVPNDPADRLIVATALVHSIPLVTRDARIIESAACRTTW